ncbi:hypothetical protein ROLI_042280 [Roseobacter fucihabitans]|uniref:Molybdenum ABC transporter ATP-binding protein n=1 Tax=Roseobacter fucihabitans TaxID=1537242 RepID=A0ABZ2BYF1_9RHOB|nr:DUF2478 domain-containing protein [Roseobacter litoralis]MBC6967804.1 hypothetical protein [Roseobacter litoralis]
MSLSPLAAIRFDQDDIDTFLDGIAKVLTARGLKLRGAMQTRGAMGGECHCADMDLSTFGSGRTFRISQPLGTGSRGCRLHPGALAECSAFIEQELRQGADLLILNRFGRGESEGRGFRDLMVQAIALDVPVRPTYVQAWSAFSAGAGCELPMDQDAILNWFRAVQRARHAA